MAGLVRTDGFPCTALIAEIITPEAIGSLLFVNHFPNWQLNFEHERELQAVKVLRLVEEQVGKSTIQVVLVGDFDADHDAASIRFWTGRQSLDNMSVCYRDAWESIHPDDSGHTFTPINPLVMNGEVKSMRPFRDWPFRRIDYIFVRFGAHGGNALDIVTCDRIFNKSIKGVWASDHFGLIADLAKPKV
jgi:endonuclease/exonuclease/phosphatase family metal-dependent hydrolase